MFVVAFCLCTPDWDIYEVHNYGTEGKLEESKRLGFAHHLQHLVDDRLSDSGTSTPFGALARSRL
jgi:hypothetical protein